MICTTIVGRVVMDPKLTISQNNSQYVKLLVSCQTDQKGENGYYVTDLFSCWFYGQLAKLVAQRVKKGMTVCVGGRSRISTWTDKNGEFRAGIAINASIFDFVKEDDKNNIGVEEATPTSGTVDW